MIRHGDCLEVMAAMDVESVDAIVTDPPYDLTSTGGRNGSPRSNPGTGPYGRQERGFMGKAWDGTGVAFRPETWAAALRVAKPSAYLLAFGGTRTVHRLATAIEDAGWIIRDMLVWAYASGFPKSKASLKPAWEPIVMARKPGPLRMLAIDACRIGTTKDVPASGSAVSDGRTHGDWPARRPDVDSGFDPNLGRWPANVILTDPIFDGDVPGVVGGGETTTHPGKVRGGAAGIYGSAVERTAWDEGPGDTGTYSRFFLVPKADRADREPVLGGLPERPVELRLTEEVTPKSWGDPSEKVYKRDTRRQNVHPTVKPTELMRHLVRLVTPPGGTVLDPFLGSGTTGLAAEMEGFAWIGIEREAEYVAIAEARLNGTQRGLGLEAS